MNTAPQPDKSLTSKGSIPDPKDKWCPKRLAPWSDFLDQQKQTLGTLHSLYPDQSRDFESLDILRGLGRRVAKRMIANEKDLEHVQHVTVETPVTFIIEQLRSHPTRETFSIGGGIVFENHPNIASDDAEESMERLSLSGPQTPHRERTFPRPYQLRADQICVYKYDDSDPTQRRMSFVVEYKPPHKLTLPHLRLGLCDMDIYTEVVNRATKPSSEDMDALFQYTSDKLAAACVVQTFHYMIEGGLEYSYLTTGEAFVFLKIDWSSPDILYYHLAEPSPEISAHPENFRHCTSISQVLAFALLALGAPTHGQDDRSRATHFLHTWKEDYESILRSIPASERKQTPPPSAFKPRTYNHVDRSPYQLRKGTKQSTRVCRPLSGHSMETHSPQPSDDESQEPQTPSQTSSCMALRTTKKPHAEANSGPTSSNSQSRPYCTQKCLLGLLQRTSLDMNCPNISLHCAGNQTQQWHLLDSKNWLRLLREQLMRTLDSDIEPLGIQGARGIMFKVTLGGYGYTVLGKGTVLAFVEDLQHEAVVYSKLKLLQGLCVPVLLGAFHLPRPYYYDFKVRVVHMTFISWGGTSIDDFGATEDGRRERRKRVRELDRSLRSIHTAGVLHRDVRKANVLWNEETQRAVFIDFERALVVGERRRLLAPLSGNSKQKQSYENIGMISSRVLSQADSELLVVSSIL
jgi:hypothetical protein